MTPWHDKSHFGSGRYAGWNPGSTTLILTGEAVAGNESADEPEAAAFFGNAIYHNDGGDGVDKGGVFPLDSGVSDFGWFIGKLYDWFGNFWEPSGNFTYGNTPYIHWNPDPTWGSRIGTHGHQNPPVPLKNKVYFFRSNSVISLKP